VNQWLARFAANDLPQCCEVMWVLAMSVVKFDNRPTNNCKHNKFLPDIISYTAWLYIDEVFVRIGGKQDYLWRAVDQDGAM
jgi:hypothetical protein